MKGWGVSWMGGVGWPVSWRGGVGSVMERWGMSWRGGVECGGVCDVGVGWGVNNFIHHKLGFLSFLLTNYCQLLYG